jgi:hypothetical protein
MSRPQPSPEKMLQAVPEMLRLLRDAEVALLLADLDAPPGEVRNKRLRHRIEMLGVRLGGFPEYADAEEVQP